MQTHWRLALMFNAPGADLVPFAAALRAGVEAIRHAADGCPVRIGVADRHPDLGGKEPVVGAREAGETDGAVEVSIPNARVRDLDAICAALRPLVEEIAEGGSMQVMTGPMFHMVPVRAGGLFLSLAFRRDPGTTNAQFRQWWHDQHSGIAIPVLGEGLLAYDQVHVDHDMSRRLAGAFGVPDAEYDAYDNLTWEDRDAYLHSISDPVAMATVLADEQGRIDHASMRHALMVDIG
ncbi:hypothetical protein V474_02915 [Novosphingobium barchaimii LL02]|uniref:EthD domain-containing protein n=1 Tax=Novosphingobium barchaimii LL02 TaxID=1114963 RepID=A0A0J7XLQ9_9SPHN|nr:EthD domain-containing protein [Novosphingobium barchaimii]KMS52018.1 hypothetical protein V474_02915 [Novosphingobium barchaimii LL02]